MLAISGFWMWVLHLGLPAAIGAVLAIVPLWLVIKALHELLDTLIEANADNKITQKEFDQICTKFRQLKSSLVGLLEHFMKNGKK